MNIHRHSHNLSLICFVTFTRQNTHLVMIIKQHRRLITRHVPSANLPRLGPASASLWNIAHAAIINATHAYVDFKTVIALGSHIYIALLIGISHVQTFASELHNHETISTNINGTVTKIPSVVNEAESNRNFQLCGACQKWQNFTQLNIAFYA